ncbi:Ankyrin repeat and LEM domain-containing protein 1 [Dirofilaria immitis]|nr:Ankyrin repeat and LEM domain-containing protein 1 [Dirofilaria immitis]
MTRLLKPRELCEALRGLHYMASETKVLPKTNVLHLLAASNSPTALDAVQNLLKTRLKHVNEREEEGLTALHVAAAWDNLAMCQLLMYFGADPFQEDDNGRTAKDMAEGSVKKFLSVSTILKLQKKSIYSAIIFARSKWTVFMCDEEKRSHSWSPSYDGTKNFLSKEEKQLRWAFRKNQPGFLGGKTKKRKQFFSAVGETYLIAFKLKICSMPKKSAEQISTPIVRSSEKSISSSIKLPKSESNEKPNSNGNVGPRFSDSTTYATAPEYSTEDNNDLSCSRNSSNASYTLSQQIASLKLGPASPETKDSRAKNLLLKIPTKILKVVRQLSDRRLKQELAKRGECIGPLVETTRPAYELKLARLIADIPTGVPKLKYSWALEHWLAGHPFVEGSKLDQILINSFAELSSEQWREGNRPTSFCYILIDPSFISFPSNICTMQQFVDAIFYIGKGKRSRPFQHLVDAVRAKGFGDGVLSKSKKLQRIVDLWDAGRGVVSLHVFQNTIPTEAFTREAAMIDAIGLRNLTNVKRGDYYGLAKNWTMKEKTIYGSYLLFNALSIFHVEGCREIYEDDVQER